jgi:proteasome lid subunit RPN8/RPN11
MATRIEISIAQYETLVQQALSAYPLEACGLMAGNEVRVQRLYPANNILKSPIAYEMDPTQQLQAMIDMEQRGWELIAIYHSHPQGPPVPSATDVAQAYYPEAAHVIISLTDQQRPTIRCFNIISGKVTEIPLQLV